MRMNNSTFIRLALPALIIAMLMAMPLGAQERNSHSVQTHTYGSPPEGKFLFPPDTGRYEKILMHYKLRCPFDGPCGEWDYLMYIYLFDHTGRIDSTSDTTYNYRVGGAPLDSVPFMRSPSWRYFPRVITNVTRTATTSLDTALVGEGTSTIVLNGDSRVNRMQFLWRKEELTAAGMGSGDITGIRFNIQTPGSRVKNLTIRMKATARDTLGAGAYEAYDLTTVYSRDAEFNGTGWRRLDFPTPFPWNGSTNIIVDISIDGADGETGNLLAATNIDYTSAILSSRIDRALHFEGADYIDVPAAAFSDVDSAITIAFWQYGNPPYQPQNQSIIEGVDQYGRRVLNIHLPWSDGQVYWDAGNLYGGYDRVNKAAQTANYEGEWNHWVFTKNVRTGGMRIYLNGLPWASGSAKRKPMTGITKFRIGAFADGSNQYDGDLDEFAVWNTELHADSIRRWAGGRDVDASGLYRSNLKVYYKFNDESLFSAADSSGNGFTGIFTGPPSRTVIPGNRIHRNFTAAAVRPNVIFEQGVYTSTYDTVVQIDSVPGDPFQVVEYKNAADPTQPTDTVLVWPVTYRYTYNTMGVAIDSVRIAPDSVYHLVKIPYMRKFEVVDRYELGRYITPYGNGLTLGEGFTWTYDVTDFKSLLHDSVHISAYNQQELVDLSFEFISGIPPRDPIAIRNVWNGGFPYGTGTSIENFLDPRKVKIPENAANSMVRMTTTGHGFGGTQNCAEFCPKIHSLLVNGVPRYDTLVWKEDCGINPVYPQGGTWVYNRSNWCPGDDVPTYNLELTPFVTPGDSVTLDYNLEEYTWNGQGSTPYYQVETQLVSYTAPNFALDAAVEAIKTPSTTDIYRRMNPICSNPLITIRNTGSTPLTSLAITYGVEGGTPSTYNWSGNLGFLESEDVQLGEFSWTGDEEVFYATASSPNGGADQYGNNNTMRSTYTFPPMFPSRVVFELKTNANGFETSYQIKDAAGNVVHSRSDLEADVVYRDTLDLPRGCYEFRLKDEGNDGLSWWANAAQGVGYMRVRNAAGGAILRTYNPDFGSEIYQQFTIGYQLSGVESIPVVEEDQVDIYPNPTSGEITIDLKLAREQDVTVTVRDLLGREVYAAPARRLATNRIGLDLSGNPAGIYIVNVHTGSGVVSRKVVVE